MDNSDSQKNGFSDEQNHSGGKSQDIKGHNQSEITLAPHKFEDQAHPINTSASRVDSPINLQRAPKSRIYSEQEIQLLYELGRLFLENGEQRKAEVLFKGIVSVEPGFKDAWLGLAYIYHYSSQVDEGIASAKRVLQLEPGSVEGSIFLVIFLYSSGEISAAGAILGEIREKVESGLVKDPNIMRIYRSQLERFASR